MYFYYYIEGILYYSKSETRARASERTFLSTLILLLLVLLLLLHLLPRVEDGTVDGVEIGEEGIVVVVVVVVAERRFVFAEEEAQERLAE